MSCDGWGVGDTCQAKREFSTRDGLTKIASNMTGKVVEIDKTAHEIVIEWSPSGRRVSFSHGQIHDYLRRIV